MSTTRLIAIFLLIFGCFNASAIAAERFTAMSANNEGVGPIASGATPEEARAKATAACRRVSNSCSSGAAVAPSPDGFFVAVCCNNPKRGCVVAAEPTREAAEKVARQSLQENGYSVCQRFGTYSTGDGKPR